MFLLHQKQELAKHINSLDKISKRQIQIDKYFLSEFNLEIDCETYDSDFDLDFCESE